MIIFGSRCCLMDQKDYLAESVGYRGEGRMKKNKGKEKEKEKDEATASKI